MGARGPAPTPTPILALHGSWRAKSRSNEPKPPQGQPQRPSTLSKPQKAIWNRLCRMLDQMALLTKVDGHQLERY